MRIGIITAMSEEYEAICGKLSKELRFLEYEEVNGLKSALYSTLDNTHMVYVLLSGVGIANSMICSSYTIYELGIDYIINVGLCGSTNDFSVYDVVYPQYIYNMDMDLTMFGREIMEDSYGDTYIMTESTTRDKNYSSNRFVTKDYFESKGILKGIFDMELYGIAKACKFKNIPFVGIKVVSDNASLEEYDFNLDEACKISSESLWEYLKKITS